MGPCDGRIGVRPKYRKVEKQKCMKMENNGRIKQSERKTERWKKRNHGKTEKYKNGKKRKVEDGTTDLL
jgi:hypothetical protein